MIYLFICFSIDFERHDDDELGFRKNDIITIVSQRDEHCWIGELNGLRGNTSLMLFVEDSYVKSNFWYDMKRLHLLLCAANIGNLGI